MKRGVYVRRANGSDRILIPDAESLAVQSSKTFITRLLLPGILLPAIICQSMAGYYWAHRDDVAPTPYLNTPVTPDLSLANAVARSLKVVDITIDIIDPSACFSTIPYNRIKLEFSKFGEKDIIKTIDPIRKKINFDVRLEEGEKYRLALVGLDNQKSEKVVVADGKDMRIELNSLCRK